MNNISAVKTADEREDATGVVIILPRSALLLIIINDGYPYINDKSRIVLMRKLACADRAVCEKS